MSKNLRLPDAWASDEVEEIKSAKNRIITIEAVRVDEVETDCPPPIPTSLSRRKATRKVQRSANTIRVYEKMARVLVPGFSQMLGTDTSSDEDVGDGVKRIKRQPVADVIEIRKGKNRGKTRRRFPLNEHQIWVLREIAKLHDAMVSKERVKAHLRAHKNYYSFDAWLRRQYGNAKN